MAEISDNRDVAVITIGLAFSGCAYSTSLISNTNPYIRFQLWDHDEMPVKALTAPTAALFNEKMQFNSFGYEAGSTYNELSLDRKQEHWFYFREFTKDLINKEIKPDMVIKDVNGKEMKAETVLSAVIAYLKTQHEKKRGIQEHRWVLTTPMALDQDSYKNLLTKAAIMAGINAKQLLIVSEAEAYLICTKTVPSIVSSANSEPLQILKKIQTSGTKFAAVDVDSRQNIYITVYSRKADGGLEEVYKAGLGSYEQTYMIEEFVEFFNELCGKSVFQKFCKDYPYSYSFLREEIHRKVAKVLYQEASSGKVTIRFPVRISKLYESENGKSLETAISESTFNGKVEIIIDKLRFTEQTVLVLIKRGMNKVLTYLEGIMKKTDVKGTKILILFGKLSQSKTMHQSVTEILPEMDILFPIVEIHIAIVKGAVIYGNMFMSYVPTLRVKGIAHFRTEIPPELLRMDDTSIMAYKRALSNGWETAYNIRVMVVGHFGVGKTTLTKRLFEESVDLGHQESTDGIEVHVKKCKVSIEDGSWHMLDEGDRSTDIYKRLAKLLNPESSSSKMDTDPGNQQSQDADESKVPILKHSADSYHDDKETNSGVKATDVVDQKEIKFEEHFEHFEEQTVLSNQASGLPKKTAIQRGESEDEMFKDLKEIVAQTWSLKEDTKQTEMADLSLWDFAGQYAFYSTHQVFLSRRAIYLLVVNMSKSIDDIVSDDYFSDSRGSRQCNVTDFVEFWLNSIHEYCGGTEDEKTPVILVGTFADKIDHAKRKELTQAYIKKLKRKLVKSETFDHLVEEVVVDNSIVDPNVDDLKKTIWTLASQQSYWGERIPANYITLENTLTKLRNEGLKILQKADLKELNKAMPVPIASDEEVEVFLNFQHETGYLLYFRENVLEDYILLEPQWLIDAFKCLVTAEKFCKSRTLYEKWLEFDEKGILTRELADTAWRAAGDGFYKHGTVILLFMEKLGLIARSVESTETKTVQDHYFAPCVLKQGPPMEIIDIGNLDARSSTSKLCFTTKSRFIPAAVFNKLLAACLEKWPLDKQKDTYMLFCGCGVFRLDTTHFLYIHFLDNIVQIWIKRVSQMNPEPQTGICEEVKAFVENFLKSARMTSAIDMFVKCPKENPLSCRAMFRADELLDISEVVCTYHDERHSLLKHELTRYWYKTEPLKGQAFDKCLRVDTLDRQPTDKELNRIAQNIGKDYQSLGRELGVTQLELEHIEMNNTLILNRINGMLIKWRSKAADEATFRKLQQTMLTLHMPASDIFYICDDM